MLTMKHTFPELEALKDKLDQQAIGLKSKLAVVQKQLDSVNTTLDLLYEHPSPQEPQDTARLFPTPQAGVSANDLQGLSQLEALVKIAQSNNNQVRLITAKELILKAGLTTSQKNAMNIIFNVIKRSGKFERVSPGIYELLPKKAAGPNTPTAALPPWVPPTTH